MRQAECRDGHSYVVVVLQSRDKCRTKRSDYFLC